jgi:hypothetical protein
MIEPFLFAVIAYAGIIMRQSGGKINGPRAVVFGELKATP